MSTTLNTGDQVADLHSASKKPRIPTENEQKLLQVLADGTARSVTDAMRLAKIRTNSTSVRRRLDPGGDLRQELDAELLKAGLGLPRVLAKLSAKMDATKTVTISKVPIEVEDNDAQLRATEQVIKLHDRTGKLPGQQDSGSSAGSITVNVLVMSEKPES